MGVGALAGAFGQVTQDSTEKTPGNRPFVDLSTLPASVEEHYQRSFRNNHPQAKAILCPPRPPGDIWHKLKMSFWLPQNDSWERGVLLAAKGQRPRRLRLSSRCARGSSHTEKGRSSKLS